MHGVQSLLDASCIKRPLVFTLPFSLPSLRYPHFHHILPLSSAG